MHSDPQVEPSIPSKLRAAYRNAHKIRRRAKVWTRAQYLRARGPDRQIKVDVGGGQTFNPGWRNLDLDPKIRNYASAFIAYSHDLRSDAPLPFADDTVSLFYTSHTMEHLPPDHMRRVLAEAHRALKSGGGLRVVVPDFDKARLAFEQNDYHWFDHWQSKARRRYPNAPHIEVLSGHERLVYQLAYYVAGHCARLPDLVERFDRAPAQPRLSRMNSSR